MPVPREFKSRLALKGWTYRELSTLTGYSVQTLRNVACGSSSNPEVRRRISSVLGVEFWPDARNREVGQSRKCGVRAKRKHGRLSQALKLRCMTAAELAQRVGVSTRTIHNLACGSNTSRRTRLRIEAELSMPVFSEPEAPLPEISTIETTK